ARTVRRAIENGEIPIARRVGRQYVVTADDVDRWDRRHHQ
ncbi:MAG: helix-turn-helix domain-containing protein, partial [Pseudomonadota bacterium]